MYLNLQLYHLEIIMRKAKVFISCGQADQREKEIGFKVQEYFRKRNFDSYFAEAVHSPEALTDNIFKNLKESEYFVFIDCRREKINENNFRGSLFVNQEVGIAAFLKIPTIGFQEQFILREGIINCQMFNCIPFGNIDDIISNLERETINWDPQSVNELHMSFDPMKNIEKSLQLNNHVDKLLSDWWLISVNNRNKLRIALNCMAYLSKVTDLNQNKIIAIPTIELIWSGLGNHLVNILPLGRREFDAFFEIQTDRTIHFNNRQLTSNSSRFQLPILFNGEYELEYTIISTNFEEVKSAFYLKHPGNHNDIEFYKIGEN